jgi:hypothetical protein
MAVFWVVVTCSLVKAYIVPQITNQHSVEVYQRFRGLCCRHHQRPQGPLKLPNYTALQTQKTVIFMPAVVMRTSAPTVLSLWQPTTQTPGSPFFSQMIFSVCCQLFTVIMKSPRAQGFH